MSSFLTKPTTSKPSTASARALFLGAERILHTHLSPNAQKLYWHLQEPLSPIDRERLIHLLAECALMQLIGNQKNLFENVLIPPSEASEPTPPPAERSSTMMSELAVTPNCKIGCEPTSWCVILNEKFYHNLRCKFDII